MGDGRAEASPAVARPRGSDRWLDAGLAASAVVAALLTLLVVAFVGIESAQAVRAVGIARWFADPAWHPPSEQFNLSPMVAGTLGTTLLAMLIAVPLGLGSATWSLYFAPRWARAPYRALVGLLAGIPSVVYGLWGLTVLVPAITRWQPPGASLLAGALVLALMVVPTVALLAESALAAVPASLLQGAAALGLGRWPTVRRVALPAARSGLLAAVALAAGRALGETMALLMVVGNVVQVPTSLFDPVRTLAGNIALEMAYAMEGHRAALFASGAVLLGLVTALVLGAERLRRGGA